MIKAAVITPWTGAGSEAEPYRPLIAEDHPIVAWKDATGQPTENIITEPNIFAAQIICTPETLETIQADPAYHVLWSFDL